MALNQETQEASGNQETREASGLRQRWLAPAVVGLLYFAAASLGFAYSHENGLAAPFWAGNAILLTGLLRSPRRGWPLLVLAAAAGLVAADVAAGIASPLIAVFVAANMVEALVAAVILRWRRPEFELADRGDALRFIVICGMVAPLISTLVAALSGLVRPGGFTLQTAESWFAADALGLVIFTPALWLGVGSHRSVSREPSRVLLFVALIAGLGLVMTGSAFVPGHFLPILMLPILGYLASEFGVAGAAIGMLAATLFTFGAATLTPYIDAPNPPIRTILYNMQVFLAGLSVFVLPMGIIVDDKKRIQDTLINCLTGEFAASAPQPAKAPEDTITTAAYIDRAGRLRVIGRESCSDAAIEAMDGSNLFEFLDPQQHRSLEASLDAAFSSGADAAPRRIRCWIQLDSDWLPVALTLLSVGRDSGDENAEALILFESSPSRSQKDGVSRAA